MATRGRKPGISPGRTQGEPALAIIDQTVTTEATDRVPRSLATSISRALNVSTSTVAQLLERQAPIVSQLSRYRRDEFLSGWQYTYLKTLAELQDTWSDMTWSHRQSAAIIMGIATDKSALVAGQPTAIIAGVHEHRHQLPQLAALLATVARRITSKTIESSPIKIAQATETQAERLPLASVSPEPTGETPAPLDHARAAPDFPPTPPTTLILDPLKRGGELCCSGSVQKDKEK